MSTSSQTAVAITPTDFASRRDTLRATLQSHNDWIEAWKNAATQTHGLYHTPAEGLKIPADSQAIQTSVTGAKIYHGYVNALNLPQGPGRWEYTTGQWKGQKYMGTFKDGLPHGYGKEQYPCNSLDYIGGCATGTFIRDEQCGLCEIKNVHASCAPYYGTVGRGQKVGFGILSWPLNTRRHVKWQEHFLGPIALVQGLDGVKKGVGVHFTGSDVVNMADVVLQGLQKWKGNALEQNLGGILVEDTNGEVEFVEKPALLTPAQYDFELQLRFLDLRVKMALQARTYIEQGDAGQVAFCVDKALHWQAWSVAHPANTTIIAPPAPSPSMSDGAGFFLLHPKDNAKISTKKGRNKLKVSKKKREEYEASLQAANKKPRRGGKQ